MTPINVKRLVEEALIPEYAHRTDACFDLTAISEKVLNTDGNYVTYGTGLAFEIPEGYVGIIAPRSSVSDRGLILANTVGIIDPPYRGEITVRFRAINDNANFYEVGDRIAQMMILSNPRWVFNEVDELSDTNRGHGGYGLLSVDN